MDTPFTFIIFVTVKQCIEFGRICLHMIYIEPIEHNVGYTFKFLFRTIHCITNRGGYRIFSQGGPVGNSATKTPQASQGKVRRGVSNMKCSRSDSEPTSGTLEIFFKGHFLGTLLQFCENTEEGTISNSKFYGVNIYG